VIEIQLRANREDEVLNNTCELRLELELDLNLPRCFFPGLVESVIIMFLRYFRYCQRYEQQHLSRSQVYMWPT
jgi:hypothetical protein